ncbi:MAG: sigma-70 family RNA polymerase sigma factor [Planctomycetales bacterium]|nr:sigma-70 family RNA polymerase sigma factor [Planctomycetales bacterium]MCA9166018.1 sigma-70 family RNA polymerase sigma factor [Planctomycetales bacterium]
MSDPEVSVEQLIQMACQGNREAIGELLDKHRGYLRVLALRQLDHRVDARVDASDVVQQTCMSVFARMAQFKGFTEAEFLVWLKMIHQHNIKNVIRHHVGTKRRSVAREVAEGNDVVSATPIRQASQTASQRLMLSEDAVRLAAALEQLPDDQAEAIRLRYLEGWTVANISARMDRSLDSVAGLIKRGLVTLKKHFSETRSNPAQNP